ncbi:ABC transporter permease [Nordella sp. HKS 07]|uniref:ABC transporter permease n=1 Tax=Nordella sp. HKS 07 TaxID=2712222 RepID=UPI0013E14DAF|nr:ABC transporter permease [Nordella sp. HKS 07]QIG47063.1 ABC transporter permease [Nordella sp. HKS 07]
MWRQTLFWLVVSCILFYMTIPAIVVVMTSFNPGEILSFPPEGFSLRWYEKALTYPDFRAAFQTGLIIALISSTLALAVGTAFAFLVVRYAFPGKSLLEGILSSPLIIPHFTTGFGFLLLGARLSLTQTLTIIIITHVVLVLPFVARAVYVSLLNIDPNLERSAANLGASPLMVLSRITIPLIIPGMAGGWLVAAILSLTEFSASLYVTASRTQTLPVAMYNYMREYTDPTVAAVSALLIISTMLILLVANHFLGLRKVLAIDSH